MMAPVASTTVPLSEVALPTDCVSVAAAATENKSTASRRPLGANLNSDRKDKSLPFYQPLRLRSVEPLSLYICIRRREVLRRRKASAFGGLSFRILLSATPPCRHQALLCRGESSNR